MTTRTRLALVDHITSPTGLVLPLARIVRELAARGVDTLVDGAHGPGMVPLDLDALGAAYYTGNGHKWLCAPKGAAILHVRRDKQEDLRPIAISHGANSPRRDRSRFRLEFDWAGTDDPTAYLALAASIDFLGGLLPGGWTELMAANREKALAGRRVLCDALAIAPPSPDEMIGSLAALPLPDDETPASSSPLATSPLQDALLHQHRIEVPVMTWPRPPHRVVRISAQLYNRPEQYVRLGEALRQQLGIVG